MKKNKAPFKKLIINYLVFAVLTSVVIGAIMYFALNKLMDMELPYLFATAHFVGSLASSAYLFVNNMCEYKDIDKIYLVVAIYNFVLSLICLVTTSFLYSLILFVISAGLSIMMIRNQFVKFYGKIS